MTSADLPSRSSLAARLHLPPLRSLLRDPRLLKLASSIVSTQVITAGLGMLFWAVAARSTSLVAIGVAGAATAAINLFGSICMLGLGTLLISELPRLAADRRRALLQSALLVSGVVGTTVGLAFALLAGYFSRALLDLRLSAFHVAAFAAGVGLTSMGLILDQAMLVVCPPSYQVWRNGIASGVKVLALLPLIAWAGPSSVAVYGSWTAGLLVATVMAVVVVFRRLKSPHRARLATLVGFARGHARSAVSHHIVNMALQTPSYLLPVIVATAVGAEANGHFTTAMLVSGFVFLVPYAISIASFAASSEDPASLAERTKRALKLSLAISISAFLVLLVLARPILAIFGPEYVDAGAHDLRLLTIAAPFLVLKDQYIAVVRSERRPRAVLWLVVARSVAEIGFPVMGVLLFGLDGAILGWVLAVAIGGLVYLVRLRRFLRLAEPPLEGVR